MNSMGGDGNGNSDGAAGSATIRDENSTGHRDRKTLTSATTRLASAALRMFGI